MSRVNGGHANTSCAHASMPAALTLEIIIVLGFGSIMIASIFECSEMRERIARLWDMAPLDVRQYNLPRI
eukprot:4108918-Pleurochrysis_carterae.AAC.2